MAKNSIHPAKKANKQNQNRKQEIDKENDPNLGTQPRYN